MHHRISGLLIVAGSAGFGLLLILGLAGAAIGTADNLMTGVILLGSATCAGLGTGLLAINGSGCIEGSAGRFGLGLVAASLLGIIGAELWVIVFPIQGDPLSSPLTLVFAGGYLGLLVGQVLVGLALVRRGGSRRIAGGLVLVGFVVVVVGASDIVVGGGDFALAVRFAGLVTLLFGWAGLGLVAVREVQGQRTARNPSGYP
jgi:hypothetical protein